MFKTVKWVVLPYLGLLFIQNCSPQNTTVPSLLSTSTQSTTSLPNNTSLDRNVTTVSSVALNGSTAVPTTNNAIGPNGTSASSIITTSLTPSANFSANVTSTSSGSSTAAPGNFTCRTSLNTSPNLSPFWVKTVLSSVPSTTDIGNCSWRDLIESRLLTLLATARALSSSSGRRRKRAAESGQLTLQLVSAVRSSSVNTKVSLVYYALLSGIYVPAESVVASLAAVSSSAASVLGYTADLPVAASYEVLQSTSSYVWLIGAMFGSLAGIVLVIWAVLLAYQRCIRPFDATKRLSTDGGAMVDDFYGDGALAHIPDMRANPRIGFSRADIGTIADEVAKHLDEHMSELARSNGPADKRRPSDDSPGTEVEESLPETRDDVIAPVRASLAKSGLDSKPDDEVEKKKKKKKKDKKNKKKKNKKKEKRRSDSSEEGSDSDSSDEDKDSASDDGADRPTDEVDAAPRVPLPMSLTMDSLRPTAGHPTSLESSLTWRASAGSLASSPYRTGDQIARIRPILEEDMKHQDLSQPRKPPVPEASSSGGDGRRLISVRPRPGRETGSGSSQSAMPAATGATRSADQDEWDVVRELARRPGSDTRALLGTIRMEVAAFNHPAVLGPPAPAASDGSKASDPTSSA